MTMTCVVHSGYYKYFHYLSHKLIYMLAIQQMVDYPEISKLSNYVTLTIGTPIVTISNYFLFLHINIFLKQMTSSIIATNKDTHFDCYVTFFIHIILV